MKATLVDHMGTDLTVVNSARVSFDKRSGWTHYGRCGLREDEVEGRCGEDVRTCCYGRGYKKELKERDQKLIKYLADHDHTSPFRHCFATFHVKAPIFVARQLVKHQVGMSWNEVSRRYVDSEPEFWWPEKWRKRAEDKKQGSGDYVSDPEQIRFLDVLIKKHVEETATFKYNGLISNGLSPEQARMILPQNVYTEWYWSGSLQAWSHMCNLRCKEDTQEETRQIALDIDAQCAKIWPVSWKALRKESGNENGTD